MKELIRKILREEYSPAGNEIIPNSIIVHKSNPVWRENILKTGLQASAGECYKTYVGYGVKCKPAIFATNSTNKRAWFDSTYDDDIWFIDTRMIPDVKWYKDRHFESTKKHIVTFDNIPPEALTLKYEGTGRDSGFINEIKDHPNPEKFNPYKDEIDRIVYSVVSEEEICGYGLEYFLNAGEDALQIVLYYNDGYYPGHKKHTDYAVDIKSMIENYLPIVNMAFVAFDSTKCKKMVTENVDEVEKNLNIIRNILETISLNGLCKIWVEYNSDDKEYEIRSKVSSKLVDMDEVYTEMDYLERILKKMFFRTYIFAPWYVDECEDEVKFMNESKEKSTKELIELTLNSLVLPQYEHVICGFEIKNVDDESLSNVINYPSVTVTFIGGKGTKLYPQTPGIQKMYDDLLDEVWDTVWDYTGISLELYSKYVRDCGKKNIYLREQKEETDYIEILKDIVEPFKEDDGVCDIDMWYDDEDDMYSVYLVFGTEELNDKFTSDGKFVYVRKKQKEVEETIKSYLPIKNIRVGSYGTPHCGWKQMNESINENWFKVPPSEYNSLEKIINLEMREKYSWWKDIKINTLNYIELYGDAQIEAELTVDEEWGANQWREFYQISQFPGNKGWEDDGYELVRFGDIIDSTYAEVIRDNLREILKYTLNIDVYNMSFRNVYLIFE